MNAWVVPTTLQHGRVRLEPLGPQHAPGLADAVADGELWRLTFTSAPKPDAASIAAYLDKALNTPDRVPFAVIVDGQVVGTTSYHDILPAVRRLEIGYTWYAASVQRTGVNTSAKIALLDHAFDTLGANVVGWRTDNLNTRSQAAIGRLGAQLDGVIRGQALRRDGSIRDTVMFSMTADEWPANRARLLAR